MWCSVKSVKPGILDIPLRINEPPSQGTCSVSKLSDKCDEFRRQPLQVICQNWLDDLGSFFSQKNCQNNLCSHHFLFQRLLRGKNLFMLTIYRSFMHSRYPPTVQHLQYKNSRLQHGKPNIFSSEQFS